MSPPNPPTSSIGAPWSSPDDGSVIKYLGSKRRLVPVLGELFGASGARSAIDLFSGTTRVAQEFKRRGGYVTAVDSARYATAFARCYVETDVSTVDVAALDTELSRLDALPALDGYVTEVFCRQSRFLQPHNGERIDGIRAEIERSWAGHRWEPILLTALVEAADRVDSTTGVQMAYLKQWAPRSRQRLTLRRPHLLAGPGRAVLGDAVEIASTLAGADLAYLDPPYNQHRYLGNYHVWETIVAGDEPDHYGVACKRSDLRAPEARSAFNSRRTMPAALRTAIERVPADVVVVSYNDESWVSADEIAAWCAPRGRVEVLAFESNRYVGARIGIHNPAGERVGTVGRLRNVEYVVVAGPDEQVGRMVDAAAHHSPAS